MCPECESGLIVYVDRRQYLLGCHCLGGEGLAITGIAHLLNGKICRDPQSWLRKAGSEPEGPAMRLPKECQDP